MSTPLPNLSGNAGVILCRVMIRVLLLLGVEEQIMWYEYLGQGNKVVNNSVVFKSDRN